MFPPELMKYSVSRLSVQLERPVRSHLKWTHRPGPHRKRRITCVGTNLQNRWAKSCKPEHKSNYPATQAEFTTGVQIEVQTNEKQLELGICAGSNVETKNGLCF
jgi:hypothetical protein